MPRLITNTDKTRRCTKCKRIKALTTEFYHKSKDRPLGFDYRCKDCSRLRIEKRKNRVFKRTPEQKERHKIWSRNYYKTKKHRIISLSFRYRSFDKKRGYKNDITKKFIEDFIYGKPCIYCGDIEKPIGLDRIDNSKGHEQNNVVPCCPDCNVFRKDSFTHDEMLIIGKTIQIVKENRKKI